MLNKDARIAQIKAKLLDKTESVKIPPVLDENETEFSAGVIFKGSQQRGWGTHFTREEADKYGYGSPDFRDMLRYRACENLATHMANTEEWLTELMRR